MRAELPTGTVTFLFSDIEGSTRLLQALGPAYTGLLEQHAALVRDALAEYEGTEIGTEGDSFFAVFRSAPQAVRATVAIQRAMAAERWPEGRQVRLRIGLHSGEGRLGGDSYVGLDVHRAARVAAAGHGGQALLTAATRALIEGALPEGVSLLDLGSHRLKDLDQPEQIAQLRIPGLADTFPPLRTLDAPMHLPVELSSFIGRRRELEEILALLASTRLLTLTGPGGTGKTRLAIQAGTRIGPDLRHGVFFVDLAPLGNAELVGPTIARALGLTEQAARPIMELLSEHLASRNVLLILDNFEHLLSAAGVVADLLGASPGTKVLVTSRSLLNLSGEMTYAVPPLGIAAVPDATQLADPTDLAQSDAVALFVERARAANSQFALTPATASAVVAICARLDGLPLAIELAASRLRVLGPEEILERLTSHRPLLFEGPRDQPDRQRTLRSTIDWSYQLLDSRLQQLFARLAVFEGGCTLAAAEAVCNPADELGMATIDGLAALVDQSLVRMLQEGDGSRFRMLETIREFALEAAAADGSLEQMADRHLAYYRDLTEKAVAENAFLGQDHAVWLDRFEREQDNLRAALWRATETADAENGLRLAAAMWRFWMQRGYLREGRKWLEDLLAMGPSSVSPVRAQGYTALGGVAYWLKDPDLTERAYESALRMQREMGDAQAELEALYDFSFVPVMRGDDQEALRRFEATRELALRLNRRDIEAQSNSSLGIILAGAGDPDGGLALLESALAYFRSTGDRFQLSWTLAQTAQVKWMLGRYRESREHSLESLELNVGAHNLPGVGANLDSTAALESRRGHHVEALRLVGASSALASRTGAVAPDMFTHMGEVEARAREAIGDEAVERELTAGRAMTIDEVVAYVRGLAV